MVMWRNAFRKSIITIFILGSLTTNASGQRPGFGPPSFGGELQRLTEFTGQVVCVGCSLEEVRTARPGNINAWDNEDFVAAIKKTGRKQLIIAGVVTEVCVVFPALSAIEEGFEVFVVTDASGTFNEVTRDAAWSRMEAAGAQLMSWFGVACELRRSVATPYSPWFVLLPYAAFSRRFPATR
jgi:hypothetical protein